MYAVMKSTAQRQADESIRPEMEPPECPVCLQPFDGDTTTPRVLACGHSACESCLTQLPQPFPHTIRCPACTQLVKYPHPLGASGFPKNIDLLRLASLLLQNPDHQNSQTPQKPNKKKQSTPISDHHFIPNLWSHELYLTWKDWVIPEDAVVVEFRSKDGFFSAYAGRIASYSDSWTSPVRCLMKGNEKVSLVRVGDYIFADDSKLNYSYIAKILWVLSAMKDGERAELGLILRASFSKQSRICRVYGLWYNSDDRGVYIVFERYDGSFLEKLGDWRTGFAGEKNESDGLLDALSFAMIGIDMCEAVIGLHSEGLFSGCLSMACFNFDDFGHVRIDLNEVFVMNRRVLMILAEAINHVQKTKELEESLKNDAFDTLAFVSPELLFKLLKKDDIDLESAPNFAVGHGSDVWSLACVLLWLLIGEPFTELMYNYLHSFVTASNDGESSDHARLYTSWMGKVRALLETKLVSEMSPLQEILCRCLNFDPQNRPVATDVWKCIRELIMKPKFNITGSLEPVAQKSTGHCLFLGELCQLQKSNDKLREKQLANGVQEKYDNCRADAYQVAEVTVERDLIEGLSGSHVRCVDLKGHLDCITGLAVGGGFLFSSSFDKTVCVWSLQDFSHVHTFRGHENKVMAVVFVNEEQPLCISGDSGGGIYIWGIGDPFGQEPTKKLFEQKDWRYSGIHALAVSGTGYLYTGSGDKSVKAWSLRDYSLSCIMNGHKSVVSTLIVCNGVLYSGSWDGTVRLWCLSDHSPLTVLGDDELGNVASVLSLAAYGNALVVVHENGRMKIWRNNVLQKSKQAQNGAIFSVVMEKNWLFTGGWDKVVNVEELSVDEFQVDAIPLGSIACNSVITVLLYWQGKLFVGSADRVTRVYYYGS